MLTFVTDSFHCVHFRKRCQEFSRFSGGVFRISGGRGDGAEPGTNTGHNPLRAAPQYAEPVYVHRTMEITRLHEVIVTAL